MRDKMIMNGNFETSVVLPMTYDEWEKINVHNRVNVSPFGENVEYGES